jgi:hypothetical protein
LTRKVLAGTDRTGRGPEPFLCQLLSRDLVLLVHPARPGVLLNAVVAAECGPRPIVRLIVASCLLRLRKEVIICPKRALDTLSYSLGSSSSFLVTWAHYHLFGLA